MDDVTITITIDAEEAKDAIREAMANFPKAARDVLAERSRQQQVEGWTHEHDDQFIRGELAYAGAAYAASHRGVRDLMDVSLDRLWPWEDAAWKPKGGRADLVRAGALIIAEIERIDRKSDRVEGAQ